MFNGKSLFLKKYESFQKSFLNFYFFITAKTFVFLLAAKDNMLDIKMKNCFLLVCSTFALIFCNFYWNNFLNDSDIKIHRLQINDWFTRSDINYRFLKAQDLTVIQAVCSMYSPRITLLLSQITEILIYAFLEQLNCRLQG